MKEPSSIRDSIQATINKIIDSPETQKELKELSSDKNALPVSIEWTGFYFITPAQEVLWFDSEERSWRTELDPQWKLHAIIQGSEKYNFLRVLIPQKPPSAIDCDQCKGIGHIIIASVRAGCGKCLELGWLSSDGTGPWNAT